MLVPFTEIKIEEIIHQGDIPLQIAIVIELIIIAVPGIVLVDQPIGSIPAPQGRLVVGGKSGRYQGRILGAFVLRVFKDVISKLFTDGEGRPELEVSCRCGN